MNIALNLRLFWPHIIINQSFEKGDILRLHDLFIFVPNNQIFIPEKIALDSTKFPIGYSMEEIMNKVNPGKSKKFHSDLGLFMQSSQNSYWNPKIKRSSIFGRFDICLEYKNE